MDNNAIQINGEKFYQRLQRVIDNWALNKSTYWGGADSLCIPNGSASEDLQYSKSAAFHLYLFGYEFPDSIILMTKNSFCFMATEKKCKIIEAGIAGIQSPISVKFLKRTKDEGLNKENMNSMVGIARKSGSKLGSLYKVEYEGNFISSWLNTVDQSQLEKVEILTGLALYFGVKDETEIDLCRRAAVLTNKVMKHGFVSEMETILDNDTTIKHDEFSTKIENIIFDPSKIGIKISGDSDVCYTPIIQSGGKYDIKVNAQSNSDILSSDIIICSLGARYKNYCANIARTYMIDVPSKIEKNYSILCSLYDICLENMIIGNEMKNVYNNAKEFLMKKDVTLLAYLPKNLGFSIGLEYRDNILILNEKNNYKFTENMIFNVIVGFHNIPLTDEDKKGSSTIASKLNTYSLLLADTVKIQSTGEPEVLTKLSKDFGDVSYSMAADKDDGNDDADIPDEEDEYDKGGVRRSNRSKDKNQASEQAAKQRNLRQQELMKKKLSDARRRMVPGGGNGANEEEDDLRDVRELAVYQSSENYPRDVLPNQVKVDLEKETLILPIHGQPVPFHISTIKSVTRPEEDRGSWMRVNFHIPAKGVLSKDIPKNMQQLIVKYGTTHVFIKEMTFRSLDMKNLTQTYQLFQELKKRVKQREQKAEQEKDLVAQMKLIKIKDQRVPRLQDVTIRPQISGRKCVGTVEAHQNGLRFTSTKGEIIDVMYPNIKHAIYQPCEKTAFVLIHFHLKDFIMMGKKKQKDVQFMTEVVDGSLNLESSRRSSYDPDELDDEQREREVRRKLNVLFKEFCMKLEKVAVHYGYSLQIDVPFRKSGFEGNCNKEMVMIQPTTHCLVNLTENPPFVLTLSDIDHAHLERVTYATKNFDLTFIYKNFDIPPKTITAVDMKYMDTIQDWLNLVEITYTSGPRSINWNDVMTFVRDFGDYFYLDVDVNGEKKPAGWLFLSAEDSENEDGEGDEEDDDESYASSADASEDGSESDDSDSDADSDEYVDSAEESDDEEDEEEEEEEEEGKSWDELEKDAIASDRVKRSMEEEIDNGRVKKIQRKR